MNVADAPASPNQPRVLRETQDWIILDKPSRWHTVAQSCAGAAAVRAARFQRPPDDDDDDVETWLRAHVDWSRDLDEAGIVHRLDFQTSGCLLVAKSENEQQRLRDRFQLDDSGIRKIYLAIVEPGLPESGEFGLFFTSRYTRSKKVTVRETGDPRHLGRCRWCKLPSPSGRGAGGGGARNVAAPPPHFDLIEIELLGPGRRHQIRAGLAHLGHALPGDTLYGGAISPPPSPGGGRGVGALGMESDTTPTPHPSLKGRGPFFLHAWKLTIDDIDAIAPVPPHWPAV